ncbi:hypothetical protein H0H87_002648, partial [Tephrocybe sp. NHM501043]
PLGGGVEIEKRTLLKISFVPYHIAASKLDLTITVVSDGKILNKVANRKTPESTVMSLPGTGSSSIITCLSPVDFTGETIIGIRVELPPNFDLAADPRGEMTQKVHSALADLLRGEERGDVKFCLFTKRRERDVGKPDILFANSSLLRGQVPFIDERKSCVFFCSVELVSTD